MRAPVYQSPWGNARKQVHPASCEHSHSAHVSLLSKGASFLCFGIQYRRRLDWEWEWERCCWPDAPEARVSLQRGMASIRLERSNCRPPARCNLPYAHIRGVRPIISPRDPRLPDTALLSLCSGLYLLGPLASTACGACLSVTEVRRILWPSCPGARSRSSIASCPLRTAHESRRLLTSDYFSLVFYPSAQRERYH